MHKPNQFAVDCEEKIASQMQQEYDKMKNVACKQRFSGIQNIRTLPLRTYLSGVKSYDWGAETGCSVVIREGHPIIRDELQALISMIPISNNIRASGTYFFIVLSFRYKQVL
ncbi:MAG: hypothetical protein IRZ01_11075 [Thermoflavifilum aggregans]|nr:hypothetical protein [Thermoflavifilum aggregans]